VAAVAFDGVWKKFRRGERHDSLRDLVPSLLARVGRPRREPPLGREEFWALQDVSFRVAPGESLGVIGPNGAGKSTILKLLTKILRPTRGHLAVEGRAAALIEVAAGFHPDLTGRENVYLQGAILGMKRREIGRKFDQIVDFAGVAEFIDTPVKRYSSGMNARLGFAIAAHLDPDVLLIDEVLSVGDVSFQSKCVERMRALITDGVPVVFVSHNLTAVVDLCQRAIFIDHGTVQFDGPAAAAVAEFRRYRPESASARAESDDGPIRITDVRLVHADDGPSVVFATGRRLTVQVTYCAPRPVERPKIAVDIHNADGVLCAGINTGMDDHELGTVEGTGTVELIIPRLALLPGAYTISVGILDAHGLRPLDLQLRAYPFSVISDRRYFGIVYLEHEWRTGIDSNRLHPTHPIGSFAAAARTNRSSAVWCAIVQEERS
jgi:lipopolysaccharide transport system ATP-binding protein